MANGLEITPRPRTLLRTGQTTSYADYDDGYWQYGTPNVLRFRDNQDGTVDDFQSGLMWVQAPHLMVTGAPVVGLTKNQIQSDEGDWSTPNNYAIGDLVSRDGPDSTPFFVCIEAHAAGANFAADSSKWREVTWIVSAADLVTPVEFTWANALTECEALVYAYHSDWRFANIAEIHSVMNYGHSSLMYQPYFSKILDTYNYWCGTTNPANTLNSYDISFSSGDFISDAKNNTFPAWPVRGGIKNAN